MKVVVLDLKTVAWRYENFQNDQRDEKNSSLKIFTKKITTRKYDFYTYLPYLLWCVACLRLKNVKNRVLLLNVMFCYFVLVPMYLVYKTNPVTNINILFNLIEVTFRKSFLAHLSIHIPHKPIIFVIPFILSPFIILSSRIIPRQTKCWYRVTPSQDMVHTKNGMDQIPIALNIWFCVCSRDAVTKHIWFDVNPFVSHAKNKILIALYFSLTVIFDSASSVVFSYTLAFPAGSSICHNTCNP